MGFLDELKKLTQPYDDEDEEYDEEEGIDDEDLEDEGLEDDEEDDDIEAQFEQLKKELGM